MSKFKAGDKVVIVSLTDVDDRTNVLRTNEEAAAFDPSLAGMIGATATVKTYISDYYDLVVTMDEPNEAYPEFNEPAMLECDLQLIKGYKVTGVIPTPISNPRRPYYDHHPSTEPKGKAEQIGEAGHTVEVTTASETVADQLASVFEKLYHNVEIEVLV